MSKMAGVLLLIVVVAMATAACGRKGAPEAPPGSDYPKTYPAW